MSAGDLTPNWRQIFRKAFDSVNSRLNCNSRLQVGSDDVDDDNPVPTKLTGSTAEVASSEDTQLATVAESYNRAEEATQIEVYVRSGEVNVLGRKAGDTTDCTATTGTPVSAGDGVRYFDPSVSVYFLQESVIRVVSR